MSDSRLNLNQNTFTYAFFFLLFWTFSLLNGAVNIFFFYILHNVDNQCTVFRIFFFYKCMMCPTYVLNKLGSQGQYSLCDNAFYFVNSLKLGCTLLKNKLHMRLSIWMGVHIAYRPWGYIWISISIVVSGSVVSQYHSYQKGQD